MTFFSGPVRSFLKNRSPSISRVASEPFADGSEAKLPYRKWRKPHCVNYSAGKPSQGSKSQLILTEETGNLSLSLSICLQGSEGPASDSKKSAENVCLPLNGISSHVRPIELTMRILTKSAETSPKLKLTRFRITTFWWLASHANPSA